MVIGRVATCLIGFGIIASPVRAETVVTAHATPTATAGTLYDYLVMNVCVDASDRITEQDPLHCPLSQQRDIRPGEAVPYFHADYPPANDTHPCYRLGLSRRYAFPLGVSGSDQTGTLHPLIIGWDDYPPTATDCQWDKYDRRDSVTILAITEGFSTILGSFNRGVYFLGLGDGYLNPATRGVARFSRNWTFPEAIPPMDGVTSGLFHKRTRRLGTSAAEIAAFPDHDPSVAFATTIQWWKRLMFVYGPLAQPTAALDTVVQFGFAKAAATGDAPGESKGSEHLYLTRELGYVTRWEDWQRDDVDLDVMTLAHRAYDNQNCGTPANTAGQISPHFSMTAVVNDAEHHLYTQVLTTIDSTTGKTTEHRWYMTGCHDYTNIHARPPLVLDGVITKALLGRPFLTLFGVPANDLP